MDKYRFMSVNLAFSSKEEVLSTIDNATSEHPVRIATVNPEFMLETERNTAFKKALENMTLCTVDGSGLFFMLKLWNKFKPELYHGADMVGDLFARYSDGTKSFFLLGGPTGLAATASTQIKKHYPKLSIVGATDGGMIDAINPQVSPELARVINAAHPDIILVGFGAPKQELWMQAAQSIVKVPTMIGVGGTFGFYTTKKRAPKVLRILHLEWLSRMVREKGHWRRVWRAVVIFPIHALFWITFGK